MPDLRVLVPKATRNLVKNPSFEKNSNGWIPAWVQEATFEDKELTPNPTGFDTTSGAVANLSINGLSPIRGDYDLQIAVSSGNETFGGLEGPDGELQLAIEFYIDPSGLTMGAAENFRVLQATGTGDSAASFNLRLRHDGSTFQLGYILNTDGPVAITGAFVPISSGVHLVRFEWKASSGADDGFLRMYIDGILADSDIDVDNDTYAVDEVEIGAIAGVDAGTSGNLNMDSLRWSRDLLGYLGSSFQITKERARFATSSLKVQTDGNGLHEGVYFKASPDTQNTPYAGSVYLRGAGTLRVRVKDGFNGNEVVSENVILQDNRWQRVQDVVGGTGGAVSDDLRLYIETAEIGAVTFYIDGAQLEEGLESTTYVDGDQPGGTWNIVANDSESTRDAQERSGGTWLALSGECREVNDIYVTLTGGLGMPPIRNNIQEFALSPGAFFQNTKVLPRVVNLEFWAKDETAQNDPGLSRIELHKLREELIDVFKSDLTRDNQPFLFEYTDGDVPMFMNLRYEAGLEGAWDVRDKWKDSFVMRMLAVEPLWFEDDQEVQELRFGKVFDSFSFVGARFDGEWNNMNFGVGGAVPSTLAIGVDGKVYAGGQFTTVNADANAIDPNLAVDEIAFWDGEKWNALPGGGITGGGAPNIRSIAIAPNGDLYAGGDFTAVGGVAALNIARYDIATDTWSALGGGASNTVHAIAVAPNGDVYVGGEFNQVNGAITARKIARWDGSSWHAIGGANNGFSDTVRSIDIASDGNTIYMGGDFTAEFGGSPSLLRIAQYDVATDTFSAMGTTSELGMDAAVRGIRIAPDGAVYAAGDFTSAGETSANRIASWNGTSWSALGEGANARVDALDIASDGTIYIAGSFTETGEIAGQSGIGIWNGSTWVSPDISATNTPANIEMKVDQDLNIYFAGNVISGTYLVSSINTINNKGSAQVSPTICITGPGILRWIENQSLQAVLYMDYALLDGEELTIDFLTNKVTSTFRGSVFDALLPNSDFGIFSLLPGENKIAVFMTNDVEAEAQIRYTPSHWSVDALT